MAALIIEKKVAAFAETLFCPMNSASNRLSADEILARCDVESLEDMFVSPYSSRLKNRGAEVLVREAVPVSCIEAVVVPSGRRLFAPGLTNRISIWRGRLRGRRRPPWAADTEGTLFP